MLKVGLEREILERGNNISENKMDKMACHVIKSVIERCWIEESRKRETSAAANRLLKSWDPVFTRASPSFSLGITTESYVSHRVLQSLHWRARQAGRHARWSRRDEGKKLRTALSKGATRSSAPENETFLRSRFFSPDPCCGSKTLLDRVFLPRSFARAQSLPAISDYLSPIICDSFE